MSIAYTIEVQHQTAGLVVGVPGDFKFFSSAPAFDAIEGRRFASLAHANRAARDLAGRRGGRHLGA